MHIYNKNNQEFPSVTTIIHILGNERLMQWSNIMGFKRKSITAILDESAEYGTYVHEYMRKIIDDNAPSPNNIPAKHLIRIKNIEPKFRSFVREHNLIVSKTEFEMVDETLGYGGTMDMFGSIRVSNKSFNDYILDFKTAKSVHSTMWLQLGGYYNLCKKYNMNPKGGGIIRINDDAIRLTLIDLDELQAYSKAFNQLKKFYDFWKDRNI